jgi:hypothetical protein
MIPKKLAPAKAGVADFSDKIMRKISLAPDPGRCGLGNRRRHDDLD